jgi:hypothetical protein
MNDYYSTGQIGVTATGLTQNKLLLFVGAAIIIYLIAKK